MAERVEGRRKLVVGGMETDIKYFKGYNVEKKFDFFLLFYDSGNTKEYRDYGVAVTEP